MDISIHGVVAEQECGERTDGQLQGSCLKTYTHINFGQANKVVFLVRLNIFTKVNQVQKQFYISFHSLTYKCTFKTYLQK
jgi:hypothetical protein